MQGLQPGELQLEVAEGAISASQLTLGHVVGGRWQLDGAGIVDHTGNAQLILYQPGHADGLLGGAHDATDAVGLDGFSRGGGPRQLGCGHQGRLFGFQPLGVGIGRTPTRPVTYIDGVQWRYMLDLGVNVLGQALEQRCLLATGDKHVVAGAQVLGCDFHIVAAQLVYRDDLLGTRNRLKGLGIEALALVAGAQQ